MDGKPDPGEPAKEEPEGYAFASAAEFSAWRSTDDADNSTDPGDGYVSADGESAPEASRGARHGKHRGSFKLRRGRDDDESVVVPVPASVEAEPVPPAPMRPAPAPAVPAAAVPVPPPAAPVVDAEPPASLSPDQSVHLDRAQHLSDVLARIDDRAERLAQRIHDVSEASQGSASPTESGSDEVGLEDGTS